MLKKIVFIGGIHGVGKSTVCYEICKATNFHYLSASELIKWKEINRDFKNKKVKSIPTTQDRLILSLNKVTTKDRIYLLDGHYCLLNSNAQIIRIPLQTFQKINPNSLNLILGDIVDVKDRLEKRDGRLYDYDLLEMMQNEELTYAKELAEILDIPLNIGYKNNFDGMLNSLLNLAQSK